MLKGVLLFMLLVPSLALATDIQTPLNVPADAYVTGMCTNNPGPFITLTGEIALGGINGRLIFQNNEKGTHQRTDPVVVDIVILKPGEVIQFNKQPPLGGVGGNPLIYFQFTDANGHPLSGMFYLGRCVQDF